MNVIDLVSDWFAQPSTWSGPDSVPTRVAEHLLYSAWAMLIAAAIALPLGTSLGHLHRGQAVVLTIANTIRALPTLGLLTLLVILSGIGFLPPLIALVVLAIPPMLVNAYEGVRNVDPAVVDAARGVGLRGPATLLSVEIPVALPIILLGVRLAAIQVISAATIAAYVGLGGLGRFIFDGLGRRDFGQVAGGSIVAALLAISTEIFFVVLASVITSPGVSRKSRTHLRGSSNPTVLPLRKKSAA
jgi:osmoprotectant transport system permease protein